MHVLDLKGRISLQDRRIPVFSLHCPDPVDCLVRLPAVLAEADRPSLVVAAPASQPDGWPRDMRFHRLSADEVLVEEGCLCCGLRSELSLFLGQLFMSLLARRQPPVTAVLVLTAAPSSQGLQQALAHASFLQQRYVFCGEIAFC